MADIRPLGVRGKHHVSTLIAASTGAGAVTTMAWLDFNGNRIWYHREGAGDPIVLLHHGEADHRMWDDQVAHLRDRYDVVAPDLLGFGRSDKPDVAYTLELYARWRTRSSCTPGSTPQSHHHP